MYMYTRRLNFHVVLCFLLVCFKIFDCDNTGSVDREQLRHMIDVMFHVRSANCSQHERVTTSHLSSPRIALPQLPIERAQVLARDRRKTGLMTSQQTISSRRFSRSRRATEVAWRKPSTWCGRSTTRSPLTFYSCYIKWVPPPSLRLEKWYDLTSHCSCFRSKVCHVLLGLKPENIEDEGNIVLWVSRRYVCVSAFCFHASAFTILQQMAGAWGPGRAVCGQHVVRRCYGLVDAVAGVRSAGKFLLQSLRHWYWTVYGR